MNKGHGPSIERPSPGAWKHHGPEPPWRGESSLGRWVYVTPRPSPESWFEDDQRGGWWEHRPKRTALGLMGDVLKNYYVPQMRATLEQETFLLSREEARS